jgi:hypothetical protein
MTMNIKHIATTGLVAAGCVLAGLAVPVPAYAQHEGGEHHEGGDRHAGADRRGGGERHDGWRGGGRDIGRFHERDVHVWREGHWEHGRHDGRYGWWWLAAGLWYFYPVPVYPYPDPYSPPVVMVQPTPAPSPAVPPPTQYWYYCDSARGYYPYVPACPGGWRAVPATPATAP